MSQADLATFRQEMANEVAQLQAVLTEAVKDMVDAARPSAPGGERRRRQVRVAARGAALASPFRPHADARTCKNCGGIIIMEPKAMVKRASIIFLIFP